MNEETRFDLRYKNGDIPWDIAKPDSNLIEIVRNTPIVKCKALDIGCGTGDNAIWLAKSRFIVTGADTSEAAIRYAKEKALENGVRCDFIKSDFLEDDIEAKPFGFVFDRGCFHSFNTDTERRKFAQNVAAVIEDGGLWLSLIGSADDPPRNSGPPQRSAGNIIKAVEQDFEILSLVSGHFDSNNPEHSRAWICLMRSRT